MTIEKRDPYTAGHQLRTAKLSMAIAQELQLSKKQITNVYLGALIHDIGKIYLPVEILTQPRKLTRAEMFLMMAHPQEGYEIIKNLALNPVIKEMAYLNSGKAR